MAKKMTERTSKLTAEWLNAASREELLQLIVYLDVMDVHTGVRVYEYVCIVGGKA